MQYPHRDHAVNPVLNQPVQWNGIRFFSFCSWLRLWNICPYQNPGNSMFSVTCLEVKLAHLAFNFLWNAGSTRKASGSGFLCYLVWSLPANSEGSVDPDGSTMLYESYYKSTFGVAKTLIRLVNNGCILLNEGKPCSTLIIYVYIHWCLLIRFTSPKPCKCC